MNKYICIHSHFYQPPRENPWVGKIERQESAYPYHDWNERITAECYLPNTQSQVFGSNGDTIHTVNNYEKMNFNFGPTLLSWIQKQKPKLYESILEADRNSRKNHSGHGSAIAQVYNHVIMPLANFRDKQTQVRWGIRDFVSRFGRMPEGIWLSETGVDIETLEVAAEADIRFTILSPRQAYRVRKIDGEYKWEDVDNEKVDTTRAYLCKLPSGKEINIFFYDNHISNGIAFGNLLDNGENFAKRLLAPFSDKKNDAQLVNLATDGETFGHHQRYGNMALAYCIHYIETRKLANITVYGEYLDKYPPAYEVEIVENSSWSCAHGVERWKSNCGCNAGTHHEWSQEWRAPLRNAMDWLRDRLAVIYEDAIERLVHDPWDIRNNYIDVILDKSTSTLETFLTSHTNGTLSKNDKLKILALLEMQKHAMLMYTSCGWFFDDISRIETVQIMQSAARAIHLAQDVCGINLEDDYVDMLKKASSNVEDFKSGDTVYNMLVRPAIHKELRFKIDD